MRNSILVLRSFVYRVIAKFSGRVKLTLGLLAILVLFSPTSVLGQDSPKTIALTDKSTVSVKDILKAMQKECPNVSISNDLTKSSYTVEAIKKTDPNGPDTFGLSLFDRDGKIVRIASAMFLSNAVKEICHAINKTLIIEVVDTQNLTQSVDKRDDNSGGFDGLANALAGRRTHTDAATMNVIVNGEHALLDCFEHRKGCVTIGPGKYYGELDTDGMSIWISHEIPVTHKPVRDHYKIAGAW